jgi:hypothetical protein
LLPRCSGDSKAYVLECIIVEVNEKDDSVYLVLWCCSDDAIVN